jgi:hypothetical protein
MVGQLPHSIKLPDCCQRAHESTLLHVDSAGRYVDQSLHASAGCVRVVVGKGVMRWMWIDDRLTNWW